MTRYIHSHRKTLGGTVDNASVQILLGRESYRVQQKIKATPFRFDALKYSF
jgi:hypothetical protein